MKFFFLLFSLFISSSLLADLEGFFQMPPTWKLVQKEKYPPFVEIVIEGKSSYFYPPTINLAVEKTDLTLESYKNNILYTQKKNGSGNYEEIGYIYPPCGLSHLASLEIETIWGEVRMLQMVHIESGYAFIVTVGGRKEEFSSFYPEFLQAFETFQVREKEKPVSFISKQE